MDERIDIPQVIDLLIVEHQRHWSALCERQWGARVVKLSECRTMQQAVDLVTKAPWAVLAVDINFAAWPELVREVVQIRRAAPYLIVVMLGRTESPSVEWELRAAGATAIVRESLDLAVLERILARQQQRAPRRQLSWHDQLWEQLPWKGSAARVLAKRELRNSAVETNPTDRKESDNQDG